MVRVKICGITNVEDVLAAVAAGADAIGLNFVGGPRQLGSSAAEEILSLLPPMVTPVALVRLANGRICAPSSKLLDEFRVSHLQLYGSVSAKSLATLVHDGFRPMPVVTVRDEGFTDQASGWLSDKPNCRPAAIVLDAFDPSREGGTGSAFRWDWIPAARRAGKLDRWPPIILAGGLRSENVAEAVRVVRPYGVDVSSGVERDGSPGKKDGDRMLAFVRAAKSVNG